MFVGQDKDRQVIEARRMLTEELPHDNYQVLKFVLDLLAEVCSSQSCTSLCVCVCVCASVRACSHGY